MFSFEMTKGLICTYKPKTKMINLWQSISLLSIYVSGFFEDGCPIYNMWQTRQIIWDNYRL